MSTPKVRVSSFKFHVPRAHALLPLNHPKLVRHEMMGHDYGNRADIALYHAQFLIGEERETAMKEVGVLIEQARWHFSRRNELADFSETEVELSEETLAHYRAERETEALRMSSRNARIGITNPGSGWACNSAAA